MFDLYLALGDSMSIDFYPAQDAERAGVSTLEDIGSASLLYRNDQNLFPEFAGQDLVTLCPGIRYVNLAVDGATCDDLLSDSWVRAIKSEPKSQPLVTLTLGGNDLLHAFRISHGRDSKNLVTEFEKVQKQYEKVLRYIRKQLPTCLLVLTTVFDPTDGTGVLPSAAQPYESNLPIEFLDKFNSYVHAFGGTESLLIADVHHHFFGHGALCGSTDNFWYWKPSPIEPSYIGASEIRRVWLDELKDRFQA